MTYGLSGHRLPAEVSGAKGDEGDEGDDFLSGHELSGMVVWIWSIIGKMLVASSTEKRPGRLLSLTRRYDLSNRLIEGLLY